MRNRKNTFNFLKATPRRDSISRHITTPTVQLEHTPDNPYLLLLLHVVERGLQGLGLVQVPVGCLLPLLDLTLPLLHFLLQTALPLLQLVLLVFLNETIKIWGVS
jgi:hypothetical protein